MRNRVIAVMLVMVAAIAYAKCSWAVIPPPRSPYDAPTSVPAEIYAFRYIAGIQDTDQYGFSLYDRPKVWAELTKKDFVLSRQRIDQKTTSGKARKLEKINLACIPYKKIVEVWFGDEALRKLAVTNLPTVSRNVWNSTANSYTPIEVFLDQRYRSPVVVLYTSGRKKRGALIVLGPTEKSYALYTLLLRQIKTKK